MNKLLQYRGIINGEWFSLIYDRKETPGVTKTLQEYIKDVDLENYWIYKRSGKQKLVSIEQLFNFEYSSYILFKKSKYDKNIIDEWCNYMVINFLDRPTPPFNPNKIVIKNNIQYDRTRNK